MGAGAPQPNPSPGFYGLESYVENHQTHSVCVGKAPRKLKIVICSLQRLIVKKLKHDTLTH